jgi:prepilin-type N-terminal cleavage/methylation domain-containing protein
MIKDSTRDSDTRVGKPATAHSIAAFTLVEMLFVIAIIGILAILVIGSFNYILMRSETVRCINSMRQIASALHAYRGDHDGWLPPGYPVSPSVGSEHVPEGMKSAVGTLHTHLIGYLTELRYNAGGGAATGDLPFCPGGMGGAARRLDSNELTYRIRGSYGMNNVLGQIKFDQYPLGVVNLGDVSITTQGPSRDNFDPSRFPFLFEIRSDGAHIFTWSFIHQNQALNGSFGETGNGWGQISPGRSHGDGGVLNFLMMAGNVETIARNDSRIVPSMDKVWDMPNNPNGFFHPSGQVPNGIPGRNPGDKVYFTHYQIGDNAHRNLYPQYAQ